MRLILHCIFAGLLSITIATPAASNECIRLWLMRNVIFHDAGYCFSSDLGRGFFDNSNCYTKNPKLTPNERRQVKQLQARESALGCAAQKNHWTVAGIRAELDRALSESRSSPSTSNRQTPAPRRSTTTPPPKRYYSFQCNVPCKRVGSFTEANRRVDITVSITAKSKMDAQRDVRAQHGNLCRDAGLVYISQYAFCN